MGKRAPAPPPAPDPQVTAAAQTASNVETARTQAALNRVSQNTPYGSLTYSQNPNSQDSWTATQTLSPQEQRLYDLSTTAQGLYGDTALAQLGKAAGALSQPINTNYGDVRQQYINSQMALIQPQLDAQRQALDAKLVNQGVPQGSVAYENAMRDFNNAQASQYNTILGNAGNTVGQAIQQTIALRDQPLNEASALLSGSQVAQPQFTNVPQTQVQPTNVLGAYDLQQQALQNAYNAQMANYGSALGGIGSLTGMLGGAAIMKYSDERLKTDISTVGSIDTAQGKVPLKTFRFRGSPVKHLGFVAQDVEKTHPDAVVTDPMSGMKGVQYARVLMGMGAGGKA